MLTRCRRHRHNSNNNHLNVSSSRPDVEARVVAAMVIHHVAACTMGAHSGRMGHRWLFHKEQRVSALINNEESSVSDVMKLGI